MIVRLVKSILGLVLLGVLLVGVPAALLLAAGNPVPEQWSLDALIAVFTERDDGSTLVRILSWVGWLAWAYLAIAVLIELISQISHIRLRVPGFTLPRSVVKPAVALLLSVFVAGGGALAHAAPAVPDTPSSSTTTASQVTGATVSKATPELGRAPTVEPVYGSTHTVDRPGENLWDLAQRYYGDGHQWQRIAHANEAMVGAQGENRLQQGWQLMIPAPVSANPTPGHIYEVTRGDNLSSIAQAAYGTADSADLIYQANTDIIDDADQIDIGWKLRLPAAPNATAAAQPAQPQPVQQPVSPQPAQAAPAAPSEQVREAPAPQETQSPAVQQPEAPVVPAGDAAPSDQSRSEHSSAEGEAELDSASLVQIGVSGLLAAGLVGLVAARRRRQAIRRRPGRRVPAPPAEARKALTAAHQIETPLTVILLDRALRSLGLLLAQQDRPLPAVDAVRLDADRVDVMLSTAVNDPPAPFTTTTGKIWTLHAADLDRLLAEPDHAAEIGREPAPYPGLVTLGRDGSGAHIMIDLESVSSLAIADTHADEILAALAVELSTSQWADDLTVTLVGGHRDLADALGVDRTRHVEDIGALLDSLEADASEEREQLESEDLDHARQSRLDPDLAADHTPHVILIDTALTDAHADRLRQVLADRPRVAVAAVTSRATSALGGWALTCAAEGDTSTSRLEPLGLAVTPQRLDAHHRQAVLSLLTHSQREDTEAAPWWDHTAAVDESRSDLPAGDPATEDGGAAVYALRPATDTDDEQTPGDKPKSPSSPQRTAALVEKHAFTVSTVIDTGHPLTLLPALDESNADTANPSSPPSPQATDELVGHQLDDTVPPTMSEPEPIRQPTLLLLGDVDLVGVTGAVSSRRSPAEVFEVVAYIHLHPGCTTTSFAEAMAGRSSDANGLASRARRLLGTNDEGEKLFPLAERRKEGTRHYRLHESVTSDWLRFHTLVDGSINTASTDSLAQALSLVRGRPIASAAPGVWSWVDSIRETMVEVIVDTAHELAERALSRGDHNLARWAINQGRLADSVTEILSRDEIRAARLAGRHLEAEHIADRIRTDAQRYNLELDPATIEMLHQITDHHRAHG